MKEHSNLVFSGGYGCIEFKEKEQIPVITAGDKNQLLHDPAGKVGKEDGWISDSSYFVSGHGSYNMTQTTQLKNNTGLFLNGPS